MVKLSRIPVNCWDARKELFGKRFHEASTRHLDDWPEESSQTALDWLNDPEGFLVIQGGPGSGKTLFCAAVLRERWTNCPNIYATHESKFYGDIKAGWKKGWDETDHIKSILDGTEAVIYNDFGTQKPSEWSEQALFTLVESIYQDSIPCILTTNLGREQISERVHQRIPSRLFAKPGKCITLWDVGDFRSKGASDNV